MTQDLGGKASIEEIQHLRGEAWKQIQGLPHVAGSMIGHKRAGGQVTDELALVILVSRKINEEELEKEQLIPKSITVRGRILPIDVVEWRRLKRHTGRFSSLGALTVCNGYDFGTLTAFCRANDGTNYGLTCAHVLMGEDQSHPCPCPIEIYDIQGLPQLIGQSLRCFNEPGQTGLFGLFDAGLFTLDDAELKQRAASATPLEIVTPVINQVVHGWGAAKELLGREVTGRVSYIDYDCTGLLLDLLIDVDGSGTFSGDSGLLWKTDKNEAVAIHVMGEDAGENVGSPSSYSMLASRAANWFGVNFFEI